MSFKTKTVRFPSKLPYIGNVGTKSVQGYWTIWEVKIRVVDYGWVMVSNPHPVHINFNQKDFQKYRGKLYDFDRLNYGFLEESKVFYCDNCNKNYSHLLNTKICVHCGAEL